MSDRTDTGTRQIVANELRDVAVLASSMSSVADVIAYLTDRANDVVR